MKTTTILYILIVLILFGTAVFLNWKINRLIQYQDNTEQLLSDRLDKVLSLTKKDFKDLMKTSNDSLFSKLKDSLNIKFKHIERTITHKYSYSYDTTLTVLIQTENKQEKQFIKKFDNCLEISGRINWEKDTIYFDKIEIDYIGKTVYYWQRSRRILGIPFGRKKHYAVTENNCTGNTETTEINLIKK